MTKYQESKDRIEKVVAFAQNKYHKDYEFRSRVKMLVKLAMRHDKKLEFGIKDMLHWAVSLTFAAVYEDDYELKHLKAENDRLRGIIKEITMLRISHKNQVQIKMKNI